VSYHKTCLNFFLERNTQINKKTCYISVRGFPWRITVKTKIFARYTTDHTRPGAHTKAVVPGSRSEPQDIIRTQVVIKFIKKNPIYNLALSNSKPVIISYLSFLLATGSYLCILSSYLRDILITL